MDQYTLTGPEADELANLLGILISNERTKIRNIVKNKKVLAFNLIRKRTLERAITYYKRFEGDTSKPAVVEAEKLLTQMPLPETNNEIYTCRQDA